MKKNHGFTLIEVLVAMAIIAGGVVILANSWSSTFMRTRKSAIYSNAATLLERKMVEIDAKYKGKPLTEIPETEDGEFEGYPQYRWTMESRDLEFPDLASVIVGQGGADEMLLQMIRQVTDQLSKAIKEVKITVFVKAGKREMNFSATNYIVDFQQDFGLPGGGAQPPGTPAGQGP